MDGGFEPMVDLAAARAAAYVCAEEWSLRLTTPFAMSNVSFVAPTSDGKVLKSPWPGDDESLHEGDALELWDGEGAVRLLRRSGRVLLEEQVAPGTDLSRLSDEEATTIAVHLASRLWRSARPPFRPVGPEVMRWLDRADARGSALVTLARELFVEVGGGAQWVVHGDFHHHNILQSGNGYVAIEPKPYLADREYDVPSFLWNPMNNRLGDAAQTERRIAAFVAAGLDDFRIRAWTVIRGSYLRNEPDYLEPLRALVS
jgi:streptomycin 6-kinase